MRVDEKKLPHWIKAIFTLAALRCRGGKLRNIKWSIRSTTNFNSPCFSNSNWFRYGKHEKLRQRLEVNSKKKVFVEWLKSYTNIFNFSANSQWHNERTHTHLQRPWIHSLILWLGCCCCTTGLNRITQSSYIFSGAAFVIVIITVRVCLLQFIFSSSSSAKCILETSEGNLMPMQCTLEINISI